MQEIFNNWKKGFTWPKILLAVVAAMLLAGVLVVVINPREQFAKMRNSERRGDVGVILNALYQYTVDNEGRLPAEIGEQPKEICKKGADCTGLLDLSAVVLKKKNTAYLGSMPVDPSVTDGNGNGYTVKKVGNRITVSAPLAEQGTSIGATR